MSYTAPQFVHFSEIRTRPAFFATWERQRHRKVHWFIELVAEAMGVFTYCYAGGSVTAAWIFGTLGEIQGLGSLLTIGLGYAMGIILALTICSATSGGHINPCITIVQWLMRGFPGRKVPGFILAQIFGGYVAFGLLYLQYHQLFEQVEHGLKLKGVYDELMFTPSGPAGIIALYVNHGSHLGYVFLNEFVVDFMLGLTIFACLDPTNLLVSPTSAPFVIAMAYAVMIWGFAPVGLAANAARDVGGRLMALTIWGTPATGGTYAAIAALTNIPATLCAALFYEVFFTDSSRVLNPAMLEHLEAHKAHSEEVGVVHHGLDRRDFSPLVKRDGPGSPQSTWKRDEDIRVETV